MVLIFVCALTLSNQTHEQINQENVPIDDLFILSSDEVLLVRGHDAQRVLLTCLWLGVNHIHTDVHVHCALRQSAWLEETQHVLLASVLANTYDTWIAFWIKLKVRAGSDLP